MPMHQSFPVPQVEFVDIQPMDISPLISKCQIKVCYVGEDPNRNGSIITKETAIEMAPSLRGAAIVGFFNENTQDFEGHNRIIDISNGDFKIKDTTRPYGFVDLNAKVWFQVFNDEGVEHEYLMTEGYLWTGQYPECQRVLERGNNQSMELDENYINADWTKDNNGDPEFFIINEAVISKLCILGEDVEPCFEGASITQMQQFSLDTNFQKQLLSMMNELTNLLKGGTEKVNENEVTLSQTPAEVIPEAAQSYEANVESQEVEAVVEEPVAAVESESVEFNQEAEAISANAIAEVVEAEENVEFKKDKKDEDKEDKEDTSNSDTNSEEEKSDDEASEDKEADDSDDDEEDKKKKKNYSLDEVVEYTELMEKYSSLETSYNEIVTERDNLKEQVSSLTAFKANIEKKEKEAMIDSFYMLSDEDKKDVVDNIDNYTLDEIEAKLSIICVRNKVSFNTEEDNHSNETTTFNLGSLEEDDSIPAWVKAALDTEKKLK